MKYLVMIYTNPATREIWESFSEEEQAAGYREHMALAEELAASGELLSSEALADPALGKRVVVRDGKTLTTDGPYAEAKELLAGFWLLDCESIEQAVEHAARIPEAAYDVIEVRPVLELGGLEM
jgi:hypothetical protein